MWCIYTSIEHFWTILCIGKRVTLIQHEQNVYYPLALAVVTLPISSVRYLWCFLPLSVPHECLLYNSKSQKRSDSLPPLSVGLRRTFCPAFFVSSVVPLSIECCAQLALFSSPPPLTFQFGASFCLKKVQGSILGCIISSISCLTSLERGQNLSHLSLDQTLVPISNLSCSLQRS